MRYQGEVITQTSSFIKDFKSIKEVTSFILEYKRQYNYKVSVYDYMMNDFIYYKPCLSYKPDIDNI